MGSSSGSRDIASKPKKPADIRSGSTAASKVDFAQPLELRQTQNPGTKQEIPDIVRADAKRKPSPSDRSKEGDNDYRSAIQEVTQAISDFQTFRDSPYDRFQTTEQQLTTAIRNHDTNIHEQFDMYIKDLMNYQKTLHKRYTELSTKTQQMEKARNTYDSAKTHLPGSEQQDLEHQYTKARDDVPDHTAFLRDHQYLGAYISRVRRYAELVQECSRLAEKNQELEKGLVLPDKEITDKLQPLLRSIQDFDQEYGIETLENKMIFKGNYFAQDEYSPYAEKIKMLEAKRETLKIDQNSNEGKKFQEQIERLKQLEQLDRALDLPTLLKIYDQYYWDIRQQVVDQEKLYSGVSNLVRQSMSWHNQAESATLFHSTVLSEEMVQLPGTIQQYVERRREINEIQKSIAEQNGVGTVDGRLGWHQVDKVLNTNYYEHIFGALGDHACGHEAILIIEKMCGAHLDDPAVVDNVLQKFPEETRTHLGLTRDEIKNGLNQSPYPPTTFKSVDLDLTASPQKKDAWTISFNDLHHLIHGSIDIDTKHSIYTPMIVSVQRDVKKNSHAVVIHAANDDPYDDSIIYYSKERVVQTHLHDLFELFKTGDETKHIILPDAYKTDPHQSGSDRDSPPSLLIRRQSW